MVDLFLLKEGRTRTPVADAKRVMVNMTML